MPRPFPSRFRPLIATLAVAALTPSAHALEHVTLRNGFSVDCAHHEIVGERIRLYTSSDDANYQELPAAQVATIEALPDPPQPAKPVPAQPELKPTALAIPTAAEMRKMLTHAGAEHNIDVELLASVVKAESNFRVDAVSRAGARGLMQLMPGTAHDLGVEDINSAGQNIAGGTAYLDSLLKLYKDDVQLALAAYNAGPAAVARYHNHVPPFPETQAYVARVIREFNRRKTAMSATTIASR